MQVSIVKGVCLIVVVAATAFAGEGADVRHARKVWTNDDFPSGNASRPAPAAPESKAAAGETTGAAPAAQPAESKASEPKEAPPALLKARVRQAAFEQTIEEMNLKLQTEKSEFRKEMYQNILRDTQQLHDSNRRLIEQLEAQVKESAAQTAETTGQVQSPPAPTER